MKTCTTCGTEKSFDEFHKQARGFGGVKAICKICTKDYRRANKDSVNMSTAKWKSSNKAHIADYNKTYRENNPDIVRIANKSWRDNNRAHKTALESKRRAKQRNATPAWLTKEQEADIKAMYILAKKLEKLCNISYHVDHIVPLAGKGVCGLHVPWNLQILPASVNIVKSNKYNGTDTFRSRS